MRYAAFGTAANQIRMTPSNFSYCNMRLKHYQIDAFASAVFKGNPAAVCPLKHWLPESTLQAIATENNAPATAFFVKGEPHYAMRWFTPTTEIPLCGHGTLAAAFVILGKEGNGRDTISFDTRGGVLGVRREGDLFTLDFPAEASRQAIAPAKLATALGTAVKEVWQAKRYLVVLDSQSAVSALRPDFSTFDWLAGHDVVVTAKGDDCDFVSRYFAPNLGIAEDHATGSTHCMLTPFWAPRLGKTRMRALQLSPRGGELLCELAGDRVLLSGRCVKYLEGEIAIDA
jgi:PhzF family phenazine biosynthesis protein